MAGASRRKKSRAPGRKVKRRTRQKEEKARGGRLKGRLVVWFVRALLVYFCFNLVLNGVLALTRPTDMWALLELGYLDSRTTAAVLLARHLIWHRSFSDEQNIDLLFDEAAQSAEIDARLLTALVEVESNRRPHVISPVGACGLTQLMPDTARELGLTDPFDPRENLSGGARYLAKLRKRFDGDLALALAAYNAGPGAVRAAGGVPPYPETRRYVERVTRRYQRLVAREP